MENGLRYFESGFSISINATHVEALGFHCFNIFKHISISVLFFIISVSCFVFLWWIFENNCPRGWGFSTIFLHQVSEFHTFFVPGGGEHSPFQKNSPGVCQGRWSGLELTDAIMNCSACFNIFLYSIKTMSWFRITPIVRRECRPSL